MCPMHPAIYLTLIRVIFHNRIEQQRFSINHAISCIIEKYMIKVVLKLLMCFFIFIFSYFFAFSFFSILNNLLQIEKVTLRGGKF